MASKPKKICDQKWPKETKPAVSICCWTFNHKNFIRKALEGILNQKTTFPVEIILHDDASSDGTGKILKGYKKKYPEIIKLVVQKKNQYSTVGSLFLEPVFNLTVGKYVAFCEGDDFWNDPLKIQKQYDCLEANPTFVMCGHDAEIVDETDQVIQKGLLPEWAKRDFSAQECLEGKTYIQTLTLMARNVIKKLPMEFGRVLNADNFLTSLLGAHGGYKYCKNVHKASYRKHRGGIWTSMDQASQVFSQLVTTFWIKKYYFRQKEYQICQEYQKRLEHTSETYLRTCGWVGLMAPNYGILRNRIRVQLLSIFENVKRAVFQITGKTSPGIKKH